MCGKGPEAAAVTSLTRYTLRAAALHDPDPVTVLTTLNTVLHERTPSGDPRYCTVHLRHLDPGRAGPTTVRLASGGHPPAWSCAPTARADYLPTPGGMLVGVLPGAPHRHRHHRPGPGDTLLLYTDGLTEARTGRGRDRDDCTARTPCAPSPPTTPPPQRTK